MVDVVGETAICSVEVKNSAGNKVDPDTHMKITIRGPSRKVVLASTAMSKDDTGEYHYDYTISDGPGKYKVLYEALNGSRYSKAKDEFTVSDESD